MIENELENRLRHMLTDDVARAPHHTEIPPLRNAPRRTARRAPVARWAGAAVVLAAAAGIAMAALPDSTPVAFAGWRSHPQPADAATIAELTKACQTSAGQGLPVVAVDLRGSGA